jgi:hypothetical protein
MSFRVTFRKANNHLNLTNKTMLAKFVGIGIEAVVGILKAEV